MEPGTPPPWQRLGVMRRLVEAGVPCTVFLAPILPGITDGEASMEAVVRAAKEHGASDVWASPLRLAPLVKEHYLGFVADAYPDLLARYERAYAAGATAPRAYREAIGARIDRVRARYGFGGEVMRDRPGHLPGARVGQAPALPDRQLALPL